MYALINNGQIVVGPRDYSKAIFQRYLDLNNIQANVSETPSIEPMVLGDGVKLLKCFVEGRPTINEKVEQLAGPFATILEDKVELRFEKTFKPVEQIKNELKQRVNSARDVKEKVGLTYQFPDGLGVIQTRSDVDIRNVQSITTTAVILKSAGVVDPVISFRDESDVTHDLTPDQTIEMGIAVQTFISNIYKWSWDKKVEIDACTTPFELNDIII